MPRSSIPSKNTKRDWWYLKWFYRQKHLWVQMCFSWSLPRCNEAPYFWKLAKDRRSSKAAVFFRGPHLSILLLLLSPLNQISPKHLSSRWWRWRKELWKQKVWWNSTKMFYRTTFLIPSKSEPFTTLRQIVGNFFDALVRVLLTKKVYQNLSIESFIKQLREWKVHTLKIYVMKYC